MNLIMATSVLIESESMISMNQQILSHQNMKTQVSFFTRIEYIVFDQEIQSVLIMIPVPPKR